MRKGTQFAKITYDYNENYHSEEKVEMQAIATVAVTEKGRIFVSYMGGWHGNEKRLPYYFITVKYSDDNGKTWSDRLFYIETNFEKIIESADPCLWIDPEGKLHLYWTNVDHRSKNELPLDPKIYGTEHFGLGYVGDWVLNEDGIGSTWEMVCQDPDSPNPKFENPHYLFDQGMLNKPLVTKTGRIIYSKYRYDNVVHFDYSDDNGKTFTKIKPIFPKKYDDVEPCLFEKSNGTVVCIWRSFNFLDKNYSYDNGETWTEIKATDIQTPFSKPAVIKLPSGLIVMCCNDDPKKRQKLCLYTSKDDGETWNKRIIDDRYSVAYPDFDYRNGKLYLVYDYNRYTDKEICLMIFNEEDILSHKVPEIISVSKPNAPISEEVKKVMASYAQSDDLNDY